MTAAPKAPSHCAQCGRPAQPSSCAKDAATAQMRRRQWRPGQSLLRTQPIAVDTCADGACAVRSVSRGGGGADLGASSSHDAQCRLDLSPGSAAGICRRPRSHSRSYRSVAGAPRKKPRTSLCGAFVVRSRGTYVRVAGAAPPPKQFGPASQSLIRFSDWVCHSGHQGSWCHMSLIST